MCAILLPLEVARADTPYAWSKPITVHTDWKDRTIWSGRALYFVNTKDRHDNTALIAYVNRAYQENPDLDPAEVVAGVNQARAEYNSLRSHSAGDFSDARSIKDDIYSFLTLLEKNPRAAAAASVAKEAVYWGTKLYEREFAPKDQIVAQLQISERNNKLREIEAKEWEDAWNLAHANPKARAVIDTVFDEINAKTSDSAESILAANPDYADHEAIKAIMKAVRPDGSIQVNLDELMRAFEQQNKAVQDLTSEARTRLGSLDQKQRSLLAWAETEKERRKQSEEAERQRMVDLLKIEAARSSVYLVSTFVGFVDPKLGHSVAVAGNAAVQVADAVSKYTESAGKLGQFGQTMGAAILTGNIVSAALSVFSLFAEQGPTQQQIILRQLQGLSEQVAALSGQMHDRFNRVDTSLFAIMSGLSENFSRIHNDLSEIRRDLAIIQKTLLELEMRINRLDGSIYSYLNDGFKRKFTEDIGYCLDSGKYFKNSSLRYDEYRRCLTNFLVYSKEHSKDSISLRDKDRGFRVDQIAEELSKPLEVNVNYLAGVSKAVLGQGISGSSIILANPVEWSIGANAYVQMASQNPDFANLTSVLGLDEMLEVGEQLKSAIRNITSVSTSLGLRPNYGFLAALVKNYKEAAEPIKQALGSARKAYQEAKGIHHDIWVAPESGVPSYRNQKAGSCGGSGIPATLQLYDEIAEWIPADYWTAQRLGLIQISVCNRVESVVSRTEEGQPANDLCKYKARRVFGALKVQIEGSFVYQNSSDKSAHPIFLRKLELPGERVLANEHITPMSSPLCPVTREDIAGGFMEKNWDKGEALRVFFMSKAESALDGGQSAPAREQLRKSTEDALKSHRKAFSETFAGALSNAEMRMALKRLDGAKALLDAYLTLGMSSTLRSNDLLRALLFGTERVFDGEMIGEYIRGSADGKLARPIEGDIDHRIDLLSDVIVSIYDHKVVDEPQELIETTIRRLADFKKARLAKLPATPIEEALKSLRAEVKEIQQGGHN